MTNSPNSPATAGHPPVLLIPGIDGTALLFYRQRPLLSERFDTTVFPLPTDNVSSMTMKSLVSELAGFVSETSAAGAILLGESFGGALAMSLAIDHPELVQGLVIVNSFPYFDERLKLRTSPWLLRSIPWAAMPIVRRYTSSHLHSPHTNPEDIDEFRARAKFIDRDSYIRRLHILASYDIRDRLEQIQAPTLFLAGDQDRLVPSVRWAQYMHERVANSTVETLMGYGHVCLIDHDLDISEHVGTWWDRVSAASG